MRDEVEDIASAIGMDVWNIEKYDREIRDVKLQAMKDNLVRGEVISKYTLIDEFLTDIICDFYFRCTVKGTNYRRLWKSKRFFVHYIMDDTSLPKKSKIADAIEDVPKDIRNAVEHQPGPVRPKRRINTVRNVSLCVRPETC